MVADSTVTIDLWDAARWAYYGLLVLWLGALCATSWWQWRRGMQIHQSAIDRLMAVVRKHVMSNRIAACIKWLPVRATLGAPHGFIDAIHGLLKVADRPDLYAATYARGAALVNEQYTHNRRLLHHALHNVVLLALYWSLCPDSVVAVLLVLVFFARSTVTALAMAVDSRRGALVVALAEVRVMLAERKGE